MTIDRQTKSNFLIRIIDDDIGVINGLSFLLKCTGWNSIAYTNPIEFLSKDRLSVPGCLLLDIRMPEMSGIELQQEFNKRGINIPIVIITGNADVDTAVKTMRLGAVNFLQKPVEGDALEAALEEAINRVIIKPTGLEPTELIEAYHKLSPREQEIMKLVTKGLTSKQIGMRLGLSERTVQGHRLNLSKKLNIHNAIELQACSKILSSLWK